MKTILRTDISDIITERHLWDIFMPSVQFMPWRAERGDKRQINLDNVKEYDWITHVPVNIAAAFVAGVQ